MKFWNNFKTCGAYFVYLLALFWMLTKEFLGYHVDWSQYPPSVAAERPQGSDLHSLKPTKTRHDVNEKSKDLEANLDSAQSASTGSNPDVSDPADTEKAPVIEEKPSCGYNANTFIIYEAHPMEKAKETSFSPTEGEPPICQARAETESLPPALSDSQAQRQAPANTTDSPAAHLNTPTVTQLPTKVVSHLNPKLEGLLANALKDALRDHQARAEDATTSRLDFVKGLKYTENSNFKFPALLSVLRARSIKSRRALKRGTIVPALISLPLSATTTSTTSELEKSIPSISTTSQPSTTPSPPLLLPTSTTISTTSSGSSYSSTYTITNLTIPTSVDEDIPINFASSLPSWRRDPERAKYVFGSLARCAGVALEPDSKLVGEDGVGRVECEGESVKECVEEEECGQGPRNRGFESIILAMGLAPLPTVPIASTLHSSSTGGDGSCNGELGDDIMQRTGAKCCTTADSSPACGVGVGGVDIGPKSRESVMSDVLSWVKSSSSSSIIHAQ